MSRANRKNVNSKSNLTGILQAINPTESSGIPMSIIPVDRPNPIPFPRVAHVYLTNTAYSVNSTGNPGLYDYVIPANDIYTTLGGTQPQYFDQLKVIYGRYKVLSSSLYVCASGAESTPATVVVFPSSNSATVGTLAEARKYPGGKFGFFTGSGNTATAKISHFATTKSVLGSSVYDDTTSAAVTAAPSKLWYWHIACAPNVAANANISLTYKLVYEVVFVDLAKDEDA